VLGLAICIVGRPYARGNSADDDRKGYRYACGPIAVWSGLRFLDIDIEFETVIEKTGWKSGQPVSLDALRQAVDSVRGVSCSAVRATPEAVVRSLQQGSVVILPIRKDSEDINHAVCAVRAVTTGDLPAIQCIDYPELVQIVTLTDLQKVWDGQALIITKCRWWLVRGVNWPLCILPLLVSVFLIVSVCRERLGRDATKCASGSENALEV